MKKVPAKERIARTVNQMMLTTSLDNMTISEICETCGVSRRTFYDNFKDKYDVIDWIYQTEAVDFLSLLGENCSWYDAVITKLNVVRNNQTFYKQAYRKEWFLTSFFNITKTLYADAITRQIGAEETKKLDTELTFYCTACVRLTGEWVLHGFKQTPEELTESFLDCIPQSLRELLLAPPKTDQPFFQRPSDAT